MNNFRDQLLICAECGGQFVFTVGEQRRMMQEQGHVEAPQHCPVCSVKLQRNAPPPAAERPQSESAELPSWLSSAESEPTHDDQAETEPATPATASEPPAARRDEAPHPLQGQNGTRHQGIVKWFNNRKGFGFITLEDGNELFVHYSGIVGEGYRSLEPDQRVTLVVEETDKGPQASQVEVVE